MARGQTIRLIGKEQRDLAHRLIDAAPIEAVVNIQEKKRTTDQNARMWAMLSDVSRAKPEGRAMTADVWKALFMVACGHQIQFEAGIDGGQPFPVGFRSSALTVKEMGDLMECISEYGSRHGVVWSEPNPYQPRAA